MLKRYVACLPPSFVVTAGLFLLMQGLIRDELRLVTPTRTPIVSTVPGRIDPPPPPEHVIPPPRPLTQPPPRPPQDPLYVRGVAEPPRVGLPSQLPGVLPVFERPQELGPRDKPLLLLARASAGYPPPAAARGQEGFVIVRFDVNVAGGVENARVVESSDRVFERSALRAAERFRYQARVVDGTPVPAQGVQVVFRFTLEAQ